MTSLDKAQASEQAQPGQLAGEHRAVPGNQVLHRPAVRRAVSGPNWSAPRQRDGAGQVPQRASGRSPEAHIK